MDIVLDIGTLLLDFVLTFFSGDEWKQIHKFIEKRKK